MGFSPCSDDLQYFMQFVVCAGLKGVAVIADDTFVYATNDTSHDANLTAVMERLKKFGLTVNADKCEIKQAVIEFFEELDEPALRHRGVLGSVTNKY